VDFAGRSFLSRAKQTRRLRHQEVRFATRRRITKIKAVATMIAAGMLPLRA
jgi:hypothetical protein